MKTALVTGATDGIGRETARQLLERGWHVLLHGRNRDKASAAAQAMPSAKGRATPVWGDLSRMGDVVGLAHQVSQSTAALDVLINNAGVYEPRRRLTEEGFEMTFAINHLAPFLLTRRLLPAVIAARPGRIVNVSSIAHESGRLDLADLTSSAGYEGYAAYAASKLANVLFTLRLARRLDAGQASANALHPGVIATKLLHAAFNIKGAAVAQGARTSVYLATAEQTSSVTGKYYVDCEEAKPSRLARDEALGEGLWLASERLLQLFL